MKTTTADQDPQAARRLRELIEEISVGMVTTVTPDGTLRSRPMLTRHGENEGELWFFTTDESGTAHDLAEEHAVNISYSEPERDHYVSVSGQASLVKDQGKARHLWEEELTRYFPKGLAEPHLALLRVRIEFAEYWDASASKMLPLSHPKRHSADAVSPERKKSPASSTGDGKGQREEGIEHTKVEIRATPASG